MKTIHFESDLVDIRIQNNPDSNIGSNFSLGRVCVLWVLLLPSIVIITPDSEQTKWRLQYRPIVNLKQVTRQYQSLQCRQVRQQNRCIARSSSHTSHTSTKLTRNRQKVT